MLSYLTNLILFLLLATITKSQTNSSSSTSTTTTSSTSTTTVAPATTTTSSTTASTTKTQVTNGTTTVTLIKSNVTSNYLLYPFAAKNENFTLPFAINQCSLFDLNENYYLKPICVSNSSVNVTFYNNSGCTSTPYSYETITNTSVFRCNESNNYAELFMNKNFSCPNSAETYVAINYCFPTVSGYASFLCSGKKLQYIGYNSSTCVNSGLLTIDQVNSTICGPLISNSTYVTLATCVNNATRTTPSTTSSTSTSTSSTTSTTKASTTSTTKGVTTSSTSSTTSTSTTKKATSSGSSVFIFNNVVYILSIVTIFKILL